MRALLWPAGGLCPSLSGQISDNKGVTRGARCHQVTELKPLDWLGRPAEQDGRRQPP